MPTDIAAQMSNSGDRSAGGASKGETCIGSCSASYVGKTMQRRRESNVWFWRFLMVPATGPAIGSVVEMETGRRMKWKGRMVGIKRHWLAGGADIMDLI